MAILGKKWPFWGKNRNFFWSKKFFFEIFFAFLDVLDHSKSFPGKKFKKKFLVLT